MATIQEGKLEFVFGPSWSVLKYDAPNGFYRTRVDPSLERTKAMDFLCLRDGAALTMIEVKDCAQGLPSREKFNRLPVAIAQKARDTLGGVVGGSHQADMARDRSYFQAVMDRLVQPPTIVYFFEDLATPARRPPQRAQSKRNVLHKELKKHLGWLTPNVVVVGLRDYTNALPDLTVRRIP